MKITEYELIEINKETKEKKITKYNIDDVIDEIDTKKNKYMIKIKEKDGYVICNIEDIYYRVLSIMRTYDRDIRKFVNQYYYLTIEEYEKKLREYEEEQEKLRQEKEKLEKENENINEN